VNDVDWGSLLFSFEGRINRAKFWAGIVVIWVVPWFLTVMAVAMRSTGMLWAAIVVYLITIWPSLAIHVKRWHDRDKSGWWVLIALIPLVGPIWSFVETGFLPGTVGYNHYGRDPLGFG